MILQAFNNHILFKTLEKTKFGSIKLKFVRSKTEYTFGEGPLVAEMRVQDYKVLHQIVRGGDIELASAIVRQDIVISDEAKFVYWACQNDEILKSSIDGSFLGTLIPRVQRLLRPNTISGAKKNIMEHYDLGNEFYNKWLDPTMSYSSALFSSPDRSDNLTEAQLRKYDRIIDQLHITENDHVLEIGCGWGGFFSRAVERTGCKVTAVMNSPAQASYNKELISRKGFKSQVDLQLMDYRNIQGQFDKIVSIEMIEAVGEKYWPTYFGKVASSLKSKGSALIQAITIQDRLFSEYRANPDFINTMVFPGGMLLANKVVQEQAEKASLKADPQPFEFGLCYAETLRRWKDSFLSAQEQNLLPVVDEKFINLWRFYLAYCEGAFQAERINVAHFSLEKA